MAIAIDAASAYRKKVGNLLAIYKELLGIDTEYFAADTPGGITDDDDNLANSDFPDITKLQFTDGVAAAQSVMATIEANKTNLYIMSDGSQR